MNTMKVDPASFTENAFKKAAQESFTENAFKNLLWELGFCIFLLIERLKNVNLRDCAFF